jgi:hypothetical protein
MKRLLLIGFLVMACGGGGTQTSAPDEPQAESVEHYVRVYGGLAGAYRVILDETDCGTLQDQFYTATDNNATGFQAAITDRAADLGCPELRFTRP